MEVSPSPAFLVILVGLPVLPLFFCRLWHANPLFQTFSAQRYRSPVFPGAPHVPGLFADVLGCAQIAVAWKVCTDGCWCGPAVPGNRYHLFAHRCFCAA